MLQRVQREVREAGDVVIGCVDPEDAALVARSVATVKWSVIEEAFQHSGGGWTTVPGPEAQG